MFLSNLPKITLKAKKRLGRGHGSGKGEKSGRGITRHQRAREDIPLGFEGGQGRLVKRFPLLRGKGKNKSLNTKPLVISVEDLAVFEDGAVVSKKTLIEKHIIRESDSHQDLKILGNGTIKKKLVIELPVSVSVKKMIEAAGGQVK
jgi:large subunit ribosomal protein L15